MQPNLENFKVTVIVSLFVLSLSFLVRHTLNYPSLESCVDPPNSSSSLPCSYSITLISFELLAAIFTTALSMLACCHDTRFLGLFGFFTALVPAFLNFISPIYFISSSYRRNATHVKAMDVFSGYLQNLAIWLALAIGFFALYVSPNLFKVPKKQKRRKNQSIVRITEQIEEEEPHFYQKTDQESAREGPSSQRQFMKREQTPRTRSTASTSTSSPSRRFLRQSKSTLSNLQKKIGLDELFS